MSNNITISTEDIGSGVQLKRTKLVLGDNGTDSGDVASDNPMPISGTVTANAGTGTFTVGGSVSVSNFASTQTVVGDAGSGSAVSGNPVLVAGSDGTDVRTLSTDTSGNLNVNPLPFKTIIVNQNPPSNYTSSGTSSTYSVGNYKYLMVGLNCTTFSVSGTISFYFQVLGPDNNWYPIGTGTSQFTISSPVSNSFVVGPGTFGYNGTSDYGSVFTSSVRFCWNFSGSGSAVFGYWIMGQS
jgi:hypothetical protein